MDGYGWQLVITVFLLIASAYFACIEVAYSSMNKVRIKSLADDGVKNAKRALAVTNDFDRLLTTILIGNNIAHITLATLTTFMAVRTFSSLDEGKVTTYTTLITTVAVFLFCEMIPKSFANARCDSVAMAFSGSVYFIMKVLTPVVIAFSGISRFIDRFFGDEEAVSFTEEELHDIIEKVEEEGVIDEDQSDLFKSALDFSDTVVGDVMTMREDIKAIDIKTPTTEIAETVKNSKYSRFPVYSGDIDNIVGILNVRTFIKAYIFSKRVNIKNILHPAYFVDKDNNIDELIEKMSENKTYMAIVMSEDKVLGLVTIEDFVEELVGEIWDEDDIVDENFAKLGGNKFLVSGSMTVGEFARRIKSKNSELLQNNKTLQIWALEQFGKVPEEEEDEFTFDNLTFSASVIEDNRIEKLEVQIEDEEEAK